MTTAVQHGYTPAQAVELAEAAVLLSGGELPEWTHDIYTRIANGELTGDAAVELIKSRLTQEIDR